MILKGSQRSGGSDLATHLMNGFENESVEIAQIRNVVGEDLHHAFAEYEAAATGTRCKKPLYSLSINPASPITHEQYLIAIDRIEEKLGLTGQPRTIVFHRKKGREHCHVVWSRIDTKEMKAIHISYDRFKLKALSIELAREFGLELPPGLDPDAGVDVAAPEPTLAENSQSDHSGITPAQRRFDITEAYMACDNGQSFHVALFELGYHLARGTRRSYVIIDQYGDVHSLSRYIEGVRSKQIKAKLSDIDPDSIPSIKDAQAQIQKPQEPPVIKHLQARLDELQSQRRLDLTNEIENLETSLREELLFLKITQQQDYEQTCVRLMTSALNLFAYIPTMGFAVHYLHTKLFARFRKLHKREINALRHRHRARLAQKQRRLNAIRKVEKREARSLQTALLRMSRITARKLDMYNVNAFDITYVSSLSQGDDKPFDPEIEALEREYSSISLTQLFNALANPSSSDSDDKGCRPITSNQCKK